MRPLIVVAYDSARPFGQEMIIIPPVFGMRITFPCHRTAFVLVRPDGFVQAVRLPVCGML